MIDYAEMSAALKLRPYMRKFWIIDNPTSIFPASTKYALPNTCFTLAFIDGPGLIVDFRDATVNLTRGSYLVGQLTQKVGIKVLPYTKAFMVQLNPWAACLLSKLPFHELTNKITKISDVNGCLARSMKDLEVSSYEVTRNRISAVLENYFYPTAASAFVASCFDAFDVHSLDEPFKIKSLTEVTGYTSRGIEKKFQQLVGLTAQQAYSIIKVRSVVNELIGENNLSLTALSYKYGYADQSHFTKSYLRVMNSSPAKFDKSEHILPFQI